MGEMGSICSTLNCYYEYQDRLHVASHSNNITECHVYVGGKVMMGSPISYEPKDREIEVNFHLESFLVVVC